MAVMEDDFAQLSVGKSTEVPMRKNHYATYITRRFEDASTSLDVGQLIKHDSLDLFDTVQALEIMDPKMDAGFLAEGETLDETFDVSRSLLPEEILWIMDQLLCYQMAWHQGYALSQNIFSSLHIDALLSNKRDVGASPSFASTAKCSHPDELTQHVLGTFCVSMIKSTDICIEIVGNQQYYEEEDFNTQTFGKELLTDFEDYNYFKVINTAVKWLRKQQKKGLISETMAGALRARLLLNCRLLESIYPIPSDFPVLLQETDSVSESLRVIALTHNMGLPVEGAFSTKLLRRLASTTPPRLLNVIRFDTAWSTLKKLYDDLSEAFNVGSLDLEADMQQIEAFLWAFADREPLALPRAAIQIHLFSEGKRAALGAEAIELIMFNEIDSRKPEHIDLSSVEDPDDQQRKAIAALAFWYKMGQQIFTNVLRCLCQNPCRIRRCLVNTVREVDELVLRLGEEYGDDIKQSHIDDKFAAGTYVQSMIYEVTRLLELRIMNWIVSLGFSQQLYDDDEIAGLALYQGSISMACIKCLRALPDPSHNHDGIIHNRDDAAAKAIFPRLNWAELGQCLVTSCAWLNIALVYLGALPALHAGHFADVHKIPHNEPFASLKSTPDLMGRGVDDRLAYGIHGDVDLLRLLNSADTVVGEFKKGNMLEMSKDFEKFKRHWIRARYSTTEAADLYWFERLKMMCKTAFEARLYANILLTELKRCGSQEAMIGRVRVEMRAVTTQFALPMKMTILAPE